MNAQEAIKIIDKTDPDLLTEEYCEALSIVLESAKLFHEHSVPRMFSKLRSGLGEEECKRIKTVYGLPIESVGIEVGK